MSPVFSPEEKGSWSSSGLLWLFMIHCALISLAKLLASSVCDPVADDGDRLVEQSREDIMASNIQELGMEIRANLLFLSVTSSGL